MVLDFDKVQRAMDTLATTQRGHEALKHLHDSLEQFRAKIGVELNFVEARYVVERLVAQRTARETSEPEVSGFSFDQLRGTIFPQVGAQPQTFLRSPAVNRVIRGGFVIRTEPA
jgi:hypothetical protein